MITREQYLEALDVVETYHQQLRKNNNEENLTRIAEWNKFNDCSIRLKNVLNNIRKGTPECIGYKEEYVENIIIHEMRKFPQCGNKSIHEFIKLRGY